MKRWWWLCGVLALASGCLQVKDELTIAPDGSGTVHMEVVSALPAELFEEMGAGARGEMGGVMYPPNTEAEAKKFFGKDATIKATESVPKDGGKKLVLEVTFKDVNALLASDYGKAHALSIKVEDGHLVVQALTGFEAAVRAAEIKNDGEMMPPLPGLADAQKKRTEMKVEFALTLPNEIATTTGAKTGKTVKWSFERAKAKDADEFGKQLGTVLQASCPSTGVTAKPVTPVRLALTAFKDVVTGAVGPQVAKPDTAKILAATKFEPYALVITRSVDLSGEGGYSQTGAKLVGAVVVPRELAPQGWGEVKLEQVVDAKGKSLLGEENERRRFSMYGHMDMSEPDEIEDDDGGGEKKPAAKPDPMHRQSVVLQFQAPEWKTKEIARIKGVAPMQYHGGAQVIKVASAIKKVVDTKQAMFGGGDEGEQKLESAELTAAGVNIQHVQCMSQNGMTMIMLNGERSKGTVTDMQVFDADGRAWPTAFNAREMGMGGMMQAMVPGKPATPLSLAFVVSGVGATVDVPILLEKIAIGSK